MGQQRSLVLCFQQLTNSCCAKSNLWYTWYMDQTKVCKVCGEEKESKKFRTRNQGQYVDNICMACRGKGDRARLKLKMFAALGQRCNCCGEVHPDFLSLDHINNDGAKHREQYNEQQIYREAERQGWPKDRYQVLCMNCNFAKGHFGECPHKTGVNAEEAVGRLFKRANTKIGHSHKNMWGSQKGWFKSGFDGRRPSEQEL